MTLWLLVLMLTLFTGMPAMAAERQVLHDQVPRPVPNLAPKGRLDGSKRLQMAFTLPSRDPDGLKQLLHDLYDPASPQYRHFITPEKFAERFGPTEENYAALADFAKAHGFTVKGRHSNRLVLDVEGAVTDIEKTFHVTMRTYQHPTEGREFYAPDSDPVVDSAQPILHVSGLDNFALPKPNSKPRPAAQNLGAAGGAASNSGSAPGGSYAGNDFRNAYLPGVSLTGTGQSVGLLEFDGYYAGDITAYETQFGLPNVPLINVPIGGGVPTVGPDNGEVCLDIEMVIAMSPGVSAIYVYESSGSWVDMLNRMVTDNVAKQLSCSWYIPNGGPNPGVEVIFQQMSAQGQSFFAASGDSDAYTGLIPFPSDSPSITQVGGTTLSTTGAGGSFVSETVWNWGGGQGSSGGVSTNYSIPTWQQGISMTNNLGSATMRNVPDVALTADNIWVTYNNGGTGSFGGTSCAAPLWAAFTALVNQQAATNGQPPVGFLNPTLYSIGKGASYATNFHDTTSGNNFNSSSPNKFPAVAGFDLATGWGSPTPALLTTLSTPPDALVISGTDLTATGPVGGPFTPASGTYTLKNNGSSSLNWTMSSSQNWLTVSPASGTLAAGATVTVAVSPNDAANALAIGTYTSTLNFVDTTTGIKQSRPSTLNVLGPPSLTVSPAGAVFFQGNVGGPFSPSIVTYTITNTGAPSMTWTASNTSGWLSLSSSGGTLAAGASTTLTASVTSAANSLPLGAYNDSITFTNTTNGSGNITTAATLNVVNEVQVPLPPQVTTYEGLTRGYWFTAPTTFVLTGLEVPTDASTGAQSIAVLKLNAAPPAYPSTTNSFTTLFLAQNNPSTGIIPVNIQINQGDVIGIMGWRGGTNSYGNSPFNTQILGQNVTFSRFGMQYSLDTTLPQNVWTETAASSLSRVYMYVSGTTNVPIITSPFTASATVGGPFSYQIFATNNPTSFAATALPPGLSINTTTGVISGTPTTLGTTAVTISATNASGTGSATLTISVQPAPPVITSTLNASGSTGSAFTYQILATNNPTSFGATGLPSGLTINTATGLISGTPTTAGTSNVTISATNAGGTGSATLALTISLTAPRITSALSRTAPINAAFSYSITATSSPTSYNAAGLPAGLSVNTTTGLISGTPTVLGTSNVTISATNAVGTGNATLVLTIAPAVPVITSATSVSGTTGAPFSYTITASNSPTSYNATGLPAGLSVNTSTGVISGTPTVSGSFAPIISATNAGGTGSATLSLYLAQPVPVITSPLQATVPISGNFSYQITATGNPSYYGVTGLPTGFSFNSSNGMITGVPVSVGTTNLTVSATNSTGTGTATLVLTVVPAAPVITSSLNVSVPPNAPFSYTITALNGPTSYTAAGLPAGWTFNSNTGVMSGTPTAAGTTNIAIGAANAVGTGTAMLTVNFQTQPPPITAFYYNGIGYISAGKTEFETSSGGFTFSATKNGYNGVSVSINGPNNSNWEIDTAAAGNVPLSLGAYPGATRYPFQASSAPGLSWYGNGRGDNQSVGTFVVRDIQYGTSNAITSFAADFVLFDELSLSSWNIGSIRYNSSVPVSYPVPPGILSSGAFKIDATSETLNGMVNPSGPPTTVYFQYGLTAAYGNTTSQQSLLAGVTANPVSVNVTGLQPSTVYHYRLVATNAWGTSTSADATFTTGTAAPVISSAGGVNAIQGETFGCQIIASNNPTNYAASGLPAGLVLNSSTGFISGSPNQPGSYPVTVSATNAAGTGNASLLLTVVTPEPAIFSALTATANTSTAFSYAIAATNSPTSFDAIGLPAGLSINTSTGVISGTPITPGISEVTITATNAFGTGKAGLILTVTMPPPVVTFASVNSIINTPFSYTISATNNPTSYSAVGLPAGLSLNTVTGVISGTPTATGFFTPTIVATNAGGSGSSSLYITVTAPPPVITSQLTASGTVSSSFSYTITGSNGPTSYSVTGLPAGLTFNSSTGVISGTPLMPGILNITISATNSGGTGSATLVLTVAPTPPIVTSPLTAAAGVNTPFSYTITATNAPTSFALSGLPAGLSFNSSTGVISGTPTATGTSNVAISATNAVGTGAAMLTITVSSTAPSAATAFYYNGVGYISGGGSGLDTPANGYTFTASKNYDNGVSVSLQQGTAGEWDIETAAPANALLVLGPYLGATRFPFQSSNTPGLSWSGNGRGDNQSSGAFNVLDIQYGSGSTITSFAADFVQFDELSTSGWNIGSIRYNSTVPISYPAAPVIVSASSSALDLNSETLNAAVNPAGPPTSVYFQYGITNAYGSTTPTQSLLAGVTGVPITATLTGLQPATIYHYRVVATSSWGTSMSADATFTTATSSPSIFSSAIAGVTTGQSFSYQIQATNSPTGYSATGLPSGLALDATTGLISGTANQIGNYPVTLRATNAYGTGTASLLLSVNPLPAISPASLAPAYAGSAYQQTLTVSGGTRPYVSLNISNFNAGSTGLTSAAVTANASAGTVVVSGTATAAGTLSFTANVTDTAGATVSQNFTLTVNAALNVPVVQTLPSYVSGVACTLTWSAVSGAVSYDVQSSASATFTTVLSTQTVTNTAATFSSLTNGSTYYYRVRANSGAPANASSPWSTTTSATQDATAPVLAITSPTTGSFTTLGSMTVTGTATDTISGIAAVTVNGVAATTSNGFAQWTATVPLSLGANVLTVIATDKALPVGNTSIATVNISEQLDSEGNGIPDWWKAAHGLSGSTGNAAADPYHTGYCNLLSYAFNLDPATFPNPSPVTVAQAINPNDGLPYLTMTYRRRIGASHLTYSVETSGDLVHWSAPAGQITTLGIAPAGDGVSENVTVRIGPSMLNGGAVFGHVRVSSP